MSIDEELLKIHKSYLHICNDILNEPWLKTLSHITGGGIVENTERVIDKKHHLNINWDAWEWPEIFKLISNDGNVPLEDMKRTFNLGIGLIMVIDKNYIDNATSYLSDLDQDFVVMGEITHK